MTIMLNGDTVSIDAISMSIEELLHQQQVRSKTGIAVAINDNIIPKSNWEEHQLNENDNILIITATQGG